MKSTLEQLQSEALKVLQQCQTSAELERAEILYLGRKGKLAEALKDLPNFSVGERKDLGKLANEVKRTMLVALTAKQHELKSGELTKVGETEALDITQPGAEPPLGHLHLTTQAIFEIEDIFARIGFTHVQYPEVDFDWYPFEGLNMPPDHPARDEWETFFVQAPAGKKGRVVLTPHGTSGDVHMLEELKPPLRAINITKCYRRQSDISHTPVIHQFDGFYVAEGSSIAELKGTMEYFVQQFFGPTRKIRLRPFHFRFTEPSFEVDISCGVCEAKGCRLCKGGWLELGGSGMIHPNVLKFSGLDPKKYKGFAFGWGVERTMMMKAGIRIDDIRTLYKNDLRFLQQF